MRALFEVALDRYRIIPRIERTRARLNRTNADRR
jgi:hypothetical protein